MSVLGGLGLILVRHYGAAVQPYLIWVSPGLPGTCPARPGKKRPQDKLTPSHVCGQAAAATAIEKAGTMWDRRAGQGLASDCSTQVVVRGSPQFARACLPRSGSRGSVTAARQTSRQLSGCQRQPRSAQMRFIVVR